jgi:hypothetical protein
MRNKLMRIESSTILGVMPLQSFSFLWERDEDMHFSIFIVEVILKI